MKIEPGAKVCITGAASGIGRATALHLASMKARLFLTDRNAEGLAETCRLVEQAGGTVCRQEPFDITDLASYRAFADSIHAEYGPLDILINNAGIALFALIEDMSHEHWKKIIDTNLWGVIHGIECFLPEMIREKHGHVVSVSSTAGLVGAPWHAAYSTAKWGLVGLSEVLRYDLAQHHIGVTVICPGAVDTPLKHSVEVLGVDMESAGVKRIIERFERHAITPERAAAIMVRAIERNQFLVITSRDIKALYLLKRACYPVYHRILRHISGMLNSMKVKGTP